MKWSECKLPTHFLPNLAKEELCHFEMVHNIIIDRGWTLGRDRKDLYVVKLLSFFPKGGSRTNQLVHRLLYAALIEARSCERFKILATNLKDEELSGFFRSLMASEAGHYMLFLNFARKYGERKEVDEKCVNRNRRNRSRSSNGQMY